MIGEKLGKYTILESIGSGSMGTVYRAEDYVERRTVAVKVVRANILYDLHRRERFLQGLLAASGIHHPGILPILEIGDDDDDFFIITPFLRGETLAQLLRNRVLDWRQSLRIVISIAEAVSAVHAAHAVHRSVKPSNIWIKTDGTVVLTDCCVSRFTEIEKPVEDDEHCRRSEPADTIIPMSALAYMSPEQILGTPIDYRTDIFSMGVILHEMITGRHPFEARNSFSRMSAIVEAQVLPLASRKLVLPAGLDHILARALAKKPSQRYQSVDEMLADLRSVASGPFAGREGSVDAVPAPASRVRSARRWILALLLALGLASVLYLVLSR